MTMEYMLIIPKLDTVSQHGQGGEGLPLQPYAMNDGCLCEKTVVMWFVTNCPFLCDNQSIPMLPGVKMLFRQLQATAWYTSNYITLTNYCKIVCKYEVICLNAS